jgi:hypothetical protein
MLAGHILLLLLAANDADAPPSRVRAELDACAERIEEMKARGGRGAELDRLLRRAQDLAVQLERAGADLPLPAHTEGPSPEELRERADAARDEADRLAAEMAALDVKIQDAHRTRFDPDAGLQRAAMGTAAAAPSPHERLHVLAAQRAQLASRRARAEADAARLEAEARDAERFR